MGRRSTKENKNIYQQSREAAGLTRAQASEKTGYISESRIEKIESEKSPAHPDEIMALAAAYKRPDLRNYYCSCECPLGLDHVPRTEDKSLSQIVLEILATLNRLEQEKERMIEITADGKISEDEVSDFSKIKKTLSQISGTIDSLQLWIDNAAANGGIDPSAFD